MMGRICAWIVATCCGLAAVVGARADETSPPGPFADAIAAARQRVVKLYGAGVGREKAYASGVIVSSDGRIVTALSVILEGRSLRAVLADGRALPAEVLARDETRQLALLKIEANDLPHFELGGSADLAPGDWLIAAANPFKVADGPEPVSVSVGVLAGRADLAARLRARDFPYDGPVLLADIIVTTPGSAGGALVDADARLVGVIGRAVISRRTNTWVNYGLPVEEVARFVSGEAYQSGHTGEEGSSDAVRLDPFELGLRLFDIGGRIRPAYVERVRPGSPASAAGLRADDLIISANGETIATCEDFRRVMNRLERGQHLTLIVKRGEALEVIELGKGDAPR